MTSDWMNDPSLQNINPAKLVLLSNLLQQGSNKNSSNIMPFLLAASRESRSKGLSFSSSEIDMIIKVLKNSVSPEETQRIDKLLSLIRMMNK